MRILFTALNCLADPASGAAISMRTVLTLLGKRGHEVMAVTGACFDSAPYATEQETLRWLKFREAEGGGWVWRDGVLQHLAFPTGTTAVGRVTGEGMAAAQTAALARATAFAPDVVLSFGGTAFELQMRHALKAQGAKTVFYLANPNYRSTTAFDGVDAILTDSVATQDLYQQRHGLASDMIGKFIRRPAVTSAAGPGVITFVNPSYEKGVTLFYRIVEMMRDVLPVARFLVVESRANLDRIEAETGLPFSSFRSVRRIGLQSDMAEVFARTRILLMPSLWHESGGRTAIEALSLGIPVVASNHGGLAEHLGEGATLIRVSDQLRATPRLIPPQSAAVPWVSVLSSLWSDAEFHAEKAAAATAQWVQHDPARRIDRLESIFARVVAS